MALRRLAGNKDLFSGNFIRSISVASPFTRSFNNQPQIPPPLPTSHRTFFSNVFDPLAQLTRSKVWDAQNSLQLNMCKTIDMKRSFSSTPESAEKPKVNIVRPLSPHLPVYKPQTSSIGSILGRISYVYLFALSLSYVLLTVVLGPVCFTFNGFYQLFFYASKFSLIAAELAVLAAGYYVAHISPLWFAASRAIRQSKRAQLKL